MLDGLMLGIMGKLGVVGYPFRVYYDNNIMLDSLKKVKFSDPANASPETLVVLFLLDCGKSNEGLKESDK
jgi:hypothetical protein